MEKSKEIGETAPRLEVGTSCPSKYLSRDILVKHLRRRGTEAAALTATAREKAGQCLSRAKEAGKVLNKQS